MQASHGPLIMMKLEPLGVFDVIGKDRRHQWSLLGDMHKAQAMEGFIDLLDRLCPSLRPYIEAIKQDRDEKRKIAEVEDEKKRVIMELDRQHQKIIEGEQHREEIQVRKSKSFKDLAI